MSARRDLREIYAAADKEPRRHDILLLGFYFSAAVLARATGVQNADFFWLLIATLGVNIACLRFRERNPGGVALVSIGLNSLLIAYLVETSGGQESALWPLFLLPVYTAAFSLPSWVLRTMGLNIALLASFYINPDALISDFRFLELTGKILFMGLSSFMMARLALQERLASLRTRRKERELHDTDSAVESALQGLSDQMTLILGTAQLVCESQKDPQSCEDLRTIIKAATHSGTITKRLRTLTYDVRRKHLPSRKNWRYGN